MGNNYFVCMEKRNKILVLLCCVLALACAWLDHKNGQARREIERLEREKSELKWDLVEAGWRRKIAEGLFCRGDAPPLSDGELFALGMQDYWKHRMQSVWRLRKELPSTARNCRPDGNACYPWKLPEYATAEQLEAGLPSLIGPKGNWLCEIQQRSGELLYETLVRVVLHGQVNHPETEQMYLPEHADGSSDFGVLHNEGQWIHWFGAGWCRLMTYAEARADSKALEKRKGYGGMTGHPRWNGDDVPPGKTLDDFRYLRVQYCKVDTNIKPGTVGMHYFLKGIIHPCDRYVTEYYLLSSCGKLIFP